MKVNISLVDLLLFRMTQPVAIALDTSSAAAALRLRVAIPVALAGLAYAIWTLWGAGIGVSAMSLILMVAGLPLYIWTRWSAPARREETPVA